MPHMVLTIGFSTPSTSGKKIYQDLFETDPSASIVEALHTLFLDTGVGTRKKPRRRKDVS